METQVIDFLSGEFYDSLDDNEKEEFMLVKNSKRRDLKFIKSEKTDKKDINGLNLRDFHFLDTNSDEIVVIISSSKLEFENGVVRSRIQALMS